MNDKPYEVLSKHIERSVSEALWAKSAGRCQFDGHNIPLYKSPVTQESVNIAQKAHIYSFSKNGPRGWGIPNLNRKKLNNVENLMLMCHSCHELIDADKNGERYSAELLRSWKKAHEDRITAVTEISSDKKSHVVFYTSNIGKERTLLDRNEAYGTISPKYYPANDQPIDLSMKWSGEDCTSEFWNTEVENLKREFSSKISHLFTQDTTTHFSLFAFAPMPLLIKLGSLFTDKTTVCTYQAIREPSGWRWQDFPEGFEFKINEPARIEGKPVLVISISDKIDYSRITDVLGEEVTIWELSVPEKYKHNDCIRHHSQLPMFRSEVRKLMVKIKEKHGAAIPLSVFPAMSISCAVEMGRTRMPKADMPWILYDQNNFMKNSFIR